MKATLVTAAVIALALGGLSCRSYAEPGPASDAGTLAGVGSVMVSINQSDPDLDAHGLSSAALTTFVTNKLNGAGIKVVTPATANFRTGGLEVTVTAVKATDEDAYALNLLVAFHQTVKLARNSSILADGITWQRTDTAFATTDSVGKYIETVGSDLDSFIASYKSANTGGAGGDKPGQGANIQVAPLAPGSKNGPS